MGDNTGPTRAELENTVSVYKSCGFNISATSRQLGKPRTTIRDHLNDLAVPAGLLSSDDLSFANDPIRRREYLSARQRKLEAYDLKKRRGDWRKPVLCTIPQGPFRLKLFGDPHMDADGFNLKLFEQHWHDMDPGSRVFGCCIGDWFDNWLRVLSHLWKDEISRPDDAWLILTELMESNGAGLIAACSGNHDDWSHGPVDPIAELMRRYGVRYRKGAIRLAIQAGDAKPIMIALRHKWKGTSMYSAAHGIRRAAEKGWADLIMVGGHTHVDEIREYVDPDSGEISHIIQLSSFKEYDDYPDIAGMIPSRIQPVVDLVIDPARDDTDPDKVVIFRDAALAKLYHDAIR